MSLTKLYPKWKSYFLFHPQQTVYEKLIVTGKMLSECDKFFCGLVQASFLLTTYSSNKLY